MFTTRQEYEALDGYGLARNKGPILAADPNDSDRVFVGWRYREWGDEKLASMVARSTNGGHTFSEPVDVNCKIGSDYLSLAVDGQRTAGRHLWPPWTPL